jgi:hypothetical protein
VIFLERPKESSRWTDRCNVLKGTWRALDEGVIAGLWKEVGTILGVLGSQEDKMKKRGSRLWQG